jgi:hypothetical protein
MATGKPFQTGNKGKPKGAKNKLTRTVKQAVLDVFNELQNDPKTDLKAFAKKFPRDFYQIAAKLIPTELDAKVKGGIIKVVRE